jgi:two-component sensor histidine kinase/CheY-like chemotaxis protein
MKKVLIVDDNIDNLYLLEVILRKKGFDVVMAMNGAEALESACRTPPDLIISDILMPVMDGFALCRKWRSDEQLRHIPFIFYTATYTNAKDEEFALSLGADRFIIKPQDPETLINMLAGFLGENTIKPSSTQPLGEEMEFFRQHNEILFKKLEKKMLDLEIANQKLKENAEALKRNEEFLHQTRRDWENIFQAIGHPAFILNPQHDIMASNRAAIRATDMTEQALAGKKCYEVFHGKDTVIPPDGCPLEKLLSSGQMETHEMQVEALGAVFLISCTPVFNGQGQLEKIIHIAMNITDRKLAENALHASLLEKELLIREVHHRVKNNMQIMLGLLDLQARSTGDPNLTEMLNEGQKRIRAMALIHEIFYNSKDFSRIDLAGYARTLSQELFQAYKINPGKIDLIIQADGAVCVDISRATPCGLILNELISNALKHAFPGDKPGRLEIIIRETKNTEGVPVIEIFIRDNGLGLPDDVDIRHPRSMGFNLINGLVTHQLDGQIEAIRGNGTEFRITFPVLFAENKGETQ